MVWTPPMTAVNGDVFTAAEYNTHVRDNLLETLTAQAVTPTLPLSAGGGRRWGLTDTKNRVRWRAWHYDYVSQFRATISGSYTDLPVSGPAVPVDGVAAVRTSGRMLVYISAMISPITNFTSGFMSFVVSDADGNDVVTPDDTRSVSAVSQTQNAYSQTESGVFYVDGLVPEAAYSVRARYRVDGEPSPSIARFTDAELLVWEL